MSYERKVDVLGVTGQRPKSLGLGSFNPKSPVWIDAYNFVQRNIKFYDAKRLVSGGALGFDIIAGKAAVEAGIELELALPFEGYDSWEDKDRRRLAWLLERSTEHYYVCDPGYAPWKYQVRNERIVERSDYILALHNGEPGGTKNCLKAAIKSGVGYHVHHPIKLISMEEV